MTDEWYRSSAWREADREHFEQKLRQARPHNRPQYIRLKGLALAGSNRRSERRAAPGLFHRVIRDHGDDELQATMAWADLGLFYAQEGKPRLAAAAFRSCLDAEAALNGALRTGSELALAEVIVGAEWEDRYPEALELLDAAHRRGLVFKVDRWRWSVAQARIAHRTRHHAEASSFARAALALLNDPSADFARHPDVGVIRPESTTLRELERLAMA